MQCLRPQHQPDKVGPKPDIPIFNSTSIHISHSVLLLADSALPLGSFAYSNGLESYLAHTKQNNTPTSKTNPSNPITSFHRFLSLSLSSLAGTALPYLLKAHRHPRELETLDNDIDASTPCTVARRASVAQGLALLNVWERAFKGAYKEGESEEERGGGAVCGSTGGSNDHDAYVALDEFSESLKQFTGDDDYDGDEDGEGGGGGGGGDGINVIASGHFAPLWGAVCLAMGIDLEQAAYVFMLNHAKAVVSAAVRASVMGPYQAQGILASKALQEMIVGLLRRDWFTEPEDAGQVVPTLDLWMGRHELLYSRIFNS